MAVIENKCNRAMPNVSSKQLSAAQSWQMALDPASVVSL
jgi:hypothetical protein